MNRFVIVSILATKGSVPRDCGAQMLIAAAETLGSIGGGTLEYQVTQTARALLASDAPSGLHQQRDYILGTDMGQCCGGQVQVSYQLTDNTDLWQDPLQTLRAQFRIVLFGAGHVGQALINVLATQPCEVHWVDSRRDLYPDTVPSNVVCHHPAHPPRIVSEMPAASYYLVMTHDHALDLDICDHVLARQDVRFLGLIGSATKAARFKRQLRGRGLSPQTLDKLTCPIGIAGINSKLPSSIAIAVTAQLLGLHMAAPLPDDGSGALTSETAGLTPPPHAQPHEINA